ncbi:hypothetical protein F5Y19DRAFT_411743 [Xylariaceae sp. FL1651]|nr:hypothetical protein F5Y19DRAFT_411743 [Xylariaceae sp. FL1651]
MNDKISKVAVAGATGNLGPVIVDTLVAAGFQVAALSRSIKDIHFPPSVAVQVVDYSSVDSLTGALNGQDAVVSALGGFTSWEPSLLLVEAAARAHVKRFIPSDYGINTANAKATSLPFFKDKDKVHEALARHAAAGVLSYTPICTGPFLDRGLETGFLVNVKQKSVVFYDVEDRLFSVTTMADVGRAVAGVLNHPEQTKNRTVYVQTAETSHKQLTEMVMKTTGSDGWKKEVVSVKDLLEEGYAERKKDQPNPFVATYNFVKAAAFGEGYGSHFEKSALDNELFGIKQLNDEELQNLVDELVSKII